jgi:hypothetical protein
MGQVKFRKKYFQIFRNFRKIEKRCKSSEKRTKPKIFGKFEKKLKVENFQKFLVLCAFYAVSYVFGFFEKIEISQRGTPLRNFKNCPNFKKMKNGCKWHETRR